MKKKFKIIFYILTFYLISFQSYAQLVFDYWKQENKFVSDGQYITIKTKLKAKNLPKHYYHNNWSYIYSNEKNITIIDARILTGKNRKITQTKNSINFNFDSIENNETVEIYFKYKQKFTNNIRYIRTEYVTIPSFAKNTKAYLKVIPYNKLGVYSYHPNFTKYLENYYVWKGIIPEKGLTEIFYMTPKIGNWKIDKTIHLKSSKKLGDLKITTPLYFQEGGNYIKNYKITTKNKNISKESKITDNLIKIDYSSDKNKNDSLKVEAILQNSYKNTFWLNKIKNLSSLTKINPHTQNILNTEILNIKRNNKQNIPTYILLAKWVNKNIKYNINYVGKKLTSEQILNTKEGVCIHYAILYRDMLRSLNIPSKIITGLAYNFNKNKFEDHAWTLVYHNGMWQAIDPTWGIYSGYLPISHIFVFDDLSKNIYFQKKGDLSDLNVEIENNVEFLD